MSQLFVQNMSTSNSITHSNEFVPFNTICQQRTFESLKSILLSFPVEVLKLTTEYAETLCTNCQLNEKADDHWHRFDDDTIFCDSCIKQLCLCRICNEIILTPIGLDTCHCCKRPICNDCVVAFQRHSYCISCFGWQTDQSDIET